MATSTATHVRFPAATLAEIEERTISGLPRSSVVIRDMQRYYRLMRIARHALRDRFTDDDLDVIRQAHERPESGAFPADSLAVMVFTYLRRHPRNEQEDNTLIHKLSDTSPLEQMALVDMCELKRG